MSRPDKPHELHELDHDFAARPSPSQEYASTQPAFALSMPHHGHTREPYGLLSDQPASYSYTPATVDYQHQYTNYLYAPSRGPEIISWTPQTGSPGTKLFVNLQDTQDLTSSRRCFFFIIFRNKAANATLLSMGQTDHYFQYAFSVDVPTADETPLEPVPLYFNMQDAQGNSLILLEFGNFSYVNDPRNPTTYSTQDVSRKRKVSTDTNYGTPSQPAKRPSTQRLHETAKEHSAMYSLPVTQEESPSPAVHYQSIPQGLPHAHADSLPSRPLQIRPPTDRTQMPSSSEYRAVQLSRSASSTQSRSTEQYANPTTMGPPFPVTIASRTKTRLPSPATSGTPQLIRTSTIQPSSDIASGSASQPFNPYSMYPHKAVLKIDGNLDAMADDWTDVEWDNRRRLVEFERSQAGSTITTTFKPVAVEDRAPNSICISCILWEERGECFVTSVDTIYLLESLVAVRFTVEEKNRIRRNLEGFHPLTISKSKTKEDSEEFFKVIMGFPNPKPRNIEKDVKVFPWKILAHALKKIISKYSASYSSTAGALFPHPASGPSSARQSDVRAESAPTASPLSTSSPAPPLVATAAQSSTALSPGVQAPAELHASPATFAQRPVVSGTASPQAGYRQYGPMLDTRYVAIPPTGTPWELGSYIDPSATSMMTHSSTPRYGPIGQYEQPRHPNSSQPPPTSHQYDPYNIPGRQP